MWPGGVIKADPDYVDQDGSIHLKFGWWRGVSGRLSIHGRRLDASAPLLGLRFSDGYRDHGLPGEWGHLFHWGMLGDHRAGGAARLTLVNVVIRV
jgi:hypothetical protein